MANTLAPEAAAETEVLLAYADLPDYLYEPLDTMAEAALRSAPRVPTCSPGRGPDGGAVDGAPAPRDAADVTVL